MMLPGKSLPCLLASLLPFAVMAQAATAPSPGDTPAGTTVEATQVAAQEAPAQATTQAATAAAPPASGRKQTFRELIHDPEDGHLDMSEWLLNHHGFLLVPIIVSDPAVGYGGGLGVMFFHRPEGSAATRTTADGKTRFISPNIYGGGALKTENGSKAYGGGAIMHFDEDRWRYRGFAGDASFNLGFYTQGRYVPTQKLAYNVDGLAAFQQVFRRIGDEDFFVGVQWVYMDMDIEFDAPGDGSFFTDKELAQKSSGLGLTLEYDTRDNPFTPTSGWTGVIEGNYYREGFGGDVDFDSYRAHALGYLPLFGRKLVVGGRLDLRAATGDVPFYRLPYVDMRGIGGGRYQDTRAGVVETELRWNLTPRWAAIGFVGAGRAWGRRNAFSDATTAVAKGLGFRYLIARKLGLYMGADYAWGPDDQTIYVQVGSAWH